MLTSVRSLMAATILAGSAFVAAPAAAQDLDIGVSANAAVVSDYRFRGVSLSDGDVAVQGGIDLELPAGFYLGTWGSSLASFGNNADFDDGTGGIVNSPVGDYGALELDVYGGWGGNFGGFTVDVGFLYYLYPNATNTDTVIGATGPSGLPIATATTDFDTDYYEFYGSLGFAIGPAEAAVGIAYAPDQDSLGDDDNLYLYVDASTGIPNTPVSISGHLGYTDGVLAPDLLADGIDETGLDWSVGADIAIGETLSVGVAYVGTEGLDIDDFTDDAVVVTLGASF